MQRLAPEKLERVWSKLTVAYGRAFAWQWDGIPMDAVMEDWAEELGAFDGKPWAIEYALQHRPLKPPLTAAMFRALCAQAPAPVVDGAAPASSDGRRVAQALGRLAPAPRQSAKEWAYRLMRRELQGDKLGRAQRESWRIGLGFTTDADVAAVASQLQVV